MTTASTKKKSATGFGWIYEKGKSLFYNLLNRKIENASTPDPIKKASTISPKRPNEPITWPLPTASLKKTAGVPPPPSNEPIKWPLPTKK